MRILKPLMLLGLMLLGLAPWCGAQEVYRSVDSEGNVTFSDTPPAGAREVTPIEIHPAPTPEQRREAETISQQIIDSGKRAGSRREFEQSRYDERVRDAEKQLAMAQTTLQNAKKQQEDDWQGLAGGGRRLKPSYFQRVEAAEKRVDVAQRNLSKVKAESP